MADVHTYEFDVTMNCGGCSGAIDRVLKKLDGTSPFHSQLLVARRPSVRMLTDPPQTGVESYEVSLENQSAKVITGLPYETVLEKIAKTGKKINAAKADGIEKSIVVPAAA